MNVYENRYDHIPITNKEISLIIEKFNNQNEGKIKLNGFDIEFAYLTKGFTGKIYEFTINKKDKFIVKQVKFNKEGVKEYELLNFMSGNAKSKLCPNFILSYGSYNKGNEYYLFMEKMNGTVSDWIKIYHDDDEWKSFLFQYLISVYVMHVYGKIYHGDLGENNIFYLNLNENNKKYFNYKINIDDKEYNFMLKHKNILFTISDFDKSKSLLFTDDKNEINYINKNIKNLSDLRRVSTMIKRMYVNYFITEKSLDEMIRIIKNNNDINFNAYYNQEQNKIKQYKMDNNSKKNVLKKSIAYYILEKEYYHFKENEIKNLPSPKITKLFENIFANYENKNLLEIIKGNFNDLIVKNNKNNNDILDQFVL